MARSEWPESSGATSGISARRSVREVDVHVGDDVCAGSPTTRRAAPGRGPSRRAAGARRRAARARARGRSPGVVGAGVVGDDDPPGEREGGAEEVVQPADAPAERELLVVDGDDDLDLRVHVSQHRAGACDPASELPESWLSGYAAGSVTTNAAPPPSALAALTRPPWAPTIAGHDRQPEPGAGLAALAPALGAPEALEERVRVVGGEAGAVVADLEPHLAVLAADVDLDRGVGGRVDERVADEVAEHLAQLVGVAEHERGAVGVDARSGGRGRWRGRRRRRRARAGRGRPARAGRRRPRPAARASAGPRPARPCAPPRPRSAASPSRRPRRSARRPSGAARRSRGSRPAACAARARRRR